MKKILKSLNTNKTFLLILLLATLIRFYNFSDRINFGPEQAISLIVSSDYVNEKFSLLGLPNVQRTTSMGHILYSPSPFNFSLVPLLIILNYDPVLITAYFAILSLITGIVLYLLVMKVFNKTIAILSAAIFLFNDYIIHHSTFIWIVNYLPLVSLLIGLMIYKLYKNKNSLTAVFTIGLLSSICIGLEYFFVFTAIFLFLLVIFISQKKLMATIFFILGAILGNLPTIIFDLSHNFYHLNTLWQYSLETINNPGQSKISYYHFFQFWPYLAILAGLAIYKIYTFSKPLASIILILIISLNLTSPKVSFYSPVGMYKNLNFSKINQAAKIIAADNPQNFNVVMTFDFDSRAHPLRYLLKYKYGFKPMGVEDYPKSKSLYVFTEESYPLGSSSLWEISSFKPTTTQKIGIIDNFSVFKLTN